MNERHCKECTLCCKLMPVRELHKVAGQRCQFQRAKGCRVYHAAGFPPSCGIWSCHWLTSDDELPRPDRAHYVIDPSPDYIELAQYRVPVLQIWVDPAFPHAHRDQALRDWLEQRYAVTGQVALVRFNSMRAIALFPPAFPLSGGKWIEKSGTATVQHSAQEIVDTYKVMP